MKLYLAFLIVIPALGQHWIEEHRVAVDYDQPVRRLESRKPFRALGLVSTVHAHARVRASIDGSSWREWRDVELGHEGGDLVWFDEPVQSVEVMAPVELRVLMIEPGEVKASMATTTPEVVSRAGWGCGPECAPKDNPSYSTVTHLVVHHSAGTNESRDWPAVIRSIWVLHVQGNGWNDIGYNYLIDPNGVIYEGRAGGDGVIGAHFSGVNTGTMGICMVGTYSTQRPAVAALEGLKKLLGWQVGRWKLDASGQSLHASSGLTLNVISGHRDAGLSPRASGTTECPGNGLYVDLPALRRDVFAQSGCNIQLARRNFCFGGDASSLAVDFDNPAGCDVGVEGGASWINVSGGRISVAANPAASKRKADLRIGGQIVEVSQAESGVTEPPCVARGGIVNAASFDTRPVASGSIVSLFGEKLWNDGARMGVILNGRYNAMIFGAAPNQINFALPPQVATGSARVEVVRDGVRGQEAMLWVTEAAPGIFAAQNFDDAKLNGSASPVKAGRPLVVYVTGIGGGSQLPWEARLGGQKLQGLYLGATPGFVGLGQANVVVPDGMTAGEYPLEIVVSGAASPAVRVSVSR